MITFIRSPPEQKEETKMATGYSISNGLSPQKYDYDNKGDFIFHKELSQVDEPTLTLHGVTDVDVTIPDKAWWQKFMPFDFALIDTSRFRWADNWRAVHSLTDAPRGSGETTELPHIPQGALFSLSDYGSDTVPEVLFAMLAAKLLEESIGDYIKFIVVSVAGNDGNEENLVRANKVISLLIERFPDKSISLLEDPKSWYRSPYARITTRFVTPTSPEVIGLVQEDRIHTMSGIVPQKDVRIHAMNGNDYSSITRY